MQEKRDFIRERDRIRKALQRKIAVGEDENGYIYSACTKQEADEAVLAAYSSIYYECENTKESNRALEKVCEILIERAGMDKHELFQLYLYFMQEEANKYADYMFDDKADNEPKRNFTVIDGKKK